MDKHNRKLRERLIAIAGGLACLFRPAKLRAFISVIIDEVASWNREDPPVSERCLYDDSYDPQTRADDATYERLQAFLQGCD